MPIIVDEVVISVEVTDAATGDSSTAPPADESQRKSIVIECVERVLDVLRDRER